MPGGTRVAGQVRLAPGPAARAATAYVRVDDVGRVDAPAVTLAEGRVQVPAGAAGFPFALRVGEHDPRGTYALSVHVDVDGDGEAGVGDYLTMQRYPVLTGADAEAMTVEARRIDG
ncbi:MAG TPA: YbaY family lipoprotein [Longimicrobium sp.]|nr:YbaY family lipoprotein [Longimicrobium sp.]